MYCFRCTFTELMKIVLTYLSSKCQTRCRAITWIKADLYKLHGTRGTYTLVDTVSNGTFTVYFCLWHFVLHMHGIR